MAYFPEEVDVDEGPYALRLHQYKAHFYTKGYATSFLPNKAVSRVYGKEHLPLEQDYLTKNLVVEAQSSIPSPRKGTSRSQGVMNGICLSANVAESSSILFANLLEKVFTGCLHFAHKCRQGLAAQTGLATENSISNADCSIPHTADTVERIMLTQHVVRTPL